jgi:hypothetical protein
VTATLKVSREISFGMELRRGPFEIVVDHQPLGMVEHNQSTTVSVEPGRHTLRMRKGRYTSHERTFEAADGQLVTFHCHGDKIWPTWLVSFVKTDLAIALRQDDAPI